MFENFEIVRILPKEREEKDMPKDKELIKAADRYNTICQKNHIHIPDLAFFAKFSLSKLGPNRFYCSKDWQQSLSNLIKIIDKENLSALIIDLEPLGKEIYGGVPDRGFLMCRISKALFPFGFTLSNIWLTDHFSKLIYIGDTDDGFSIKRHYENNPLIGLDFDPNYDDEDKR